MISFPVLLSNAPVGSSARIMSAPQAMVLAIATRCKTLGEAYTEEAIAERIKGKVITKEPKPERKGVSLLIDIENSIKAQQSAGYERWAKIENLKRAARTMVFLDQNGIARYADLEQKIAALQGENEQTAATLKDVEHRLSDMALLIKNITTYKELKLLYDEYKKTVIKKNICAGMKVKSSSLKLRQRH